MYYLTTLLLTIISISTVHAELTFKSKRADVSVAADAKEVTIPFYFQNKTKKPITIARMDTACSCLYSKVKDKKMTYQPGEKGEIEVRFELGKFSGEVNKSLLLWTTDDAAESPSSVLTSYITIPKLFVVTPVTTFWKLGEKTVTKTVRLKVTDKKPIKINKHSITSSNFSYELVTIRDGWEYELKITPKDTSKTGFGILKIKTDSKISRYKTIMAYCCVKK